MAQNPVLITTPFAKNGDRTTPPNTNLPSDGRFSQSLGFPPITAIPLTSGGKAVKREDMNGLLNMLSEVLFYAQKGWTFYYDATQDYYAGCVVIDPADGWRYECIADMPAGTIAPSADLTETYWKKFSLSGAGGGVPAGTIISYAGQTDPDGWLLCDGSPVSRTTYPDLFAAIGTLYGAGDGSTTFNLPDLTDKFLQGSATPAITKTAGLPNISGQINANSDYCDYLLSPGSTSGAFSYTSTNKKTLADGTSTRGSVKTITFSASKSNSIYGASDTVQPPAVTVRFLIKASGASGSQGTATNTAVQNMLTGVFS